jgi:hypothetical protein
MTQVCSNNSEPDLIGDLARRAVILGWAQAVGELLQAASEANNPLTKRAFTLAAERLNTAMNEGYKNPSSCLPNTNSERGSCEKP